MEATTYRDSWARVLVAMDLPYAMIIDRLMDDLGFTYEEAATAALREARLRALPKLETRTHSEHLT